MLISLLVPFYWDTFAPSFLIHLNMSYNNNLQREADQVGYFDSNEESEMFAKRLVSAISKGNDHISLTLTEKGAIAFARELSECILAEKAAQTTDKQEDDSALLTKQEVMDRLDVSCTTLWLWEKKNYLMPVKIGRKVFYRTGDINRLCSKV